MQHVSSWGRSFKPWPVLLLFCGLAVLWGRWPIVALDFDLWYHLTGGAWIVQHLRLPDAPFFSYAPTGKGWVDYYWLFQVLVHGLYQVGGYVALSLLRAALYLAAVWGVFTYFRAAREDDGTGAAVLTLFFTCAYALALQPREVLLRPHAFTYLFIIFLHYVLNYRQRLAWALPVLTVVWANLHGVEYPVVMLVLGAYLGEYFLAKLMRRERAAARYKSVRWPAILSLYAICVTPAGLSLLAKAFDGPPFHERVVMELAAQPLDRFLALFFYPDERLMAGVTNALVLAAALGGLWLAVNRRLRVSRVVLFAGGMVLLPMMRRFTYEYMLLTLPILGDATALAVARFSRPVKARTAAIVSLAAVALTLWTSAAFLGYRPHYPVDTARLPVGVCDFLLQKGLGGRIFNVPNPGGYLQWRLFPKYKIYMDMQTMLFPGLDLFTSVNAFGDAQIMRGVLRDYAPGFLLGDVQDKDFAKRLEKIGGHFVPVFFDDMLTLYADADKYPDLVARYKLTALSPATCVTADYEAMDAKEREAAMAECQRLLAIYPEGLAVNTVAAKILLAEGRTHEASGIAARLMKRFPARYMGYALDGLAAFKEGRYEDSLSRNKEALARALPSEREMVVRNLYATYARLKEFGKAYETLLSVVNPMAFSTKFTDLYDLAMSAIASGKSREGGLLLAMAKAKAGPGDADKVKEIESLQEMLRRG
ncbi:pilus assembly protein TadD [Solidesulfovibrio sp. C21]|uniref:pilus assembly protein TadD n=1 Tax=Solidesulfovibrio sp. C21 TaxID=3398613 RepID=UPI0039FC338F